MNENEKLETTPVAVDPVEFTPEVEKVDPLDPREKAANLRRQFKALEHELLDDIRVAETKLLAKVAKLAELRGQELKARRALAPDSAMSEMHLSSALNDADTLEKLGVVAEKFKNGWRPAR